MIVILRRFDLINVEAFPHNLAELHHVPSLEPAQKLRYGPCQALHQKSNMPFADANDGGDAMVENEGFNSLGTRSLRYWSARVWNEVRSGALDRSTWTWKSDSADLVMQWTALSQREGSGTRARCLGVRRQQHWHRSFRWWGLKTSRELRESLGNGGMREAGGVVSENCSSSISYPQYILSFWYLSL
ncbi:hypothetical protein FF2_002709 [Malus domestica]